MGKFDEEASTAPLEMLDSNYPPEAQFDLPLENDSLFEFGVAGDRIRCIDIAIARLAPADGDVVLVEIAHGPASRERRIMRLKIEAGARRLLPFGRDAGEGALSESESEIKIIAKLLYIYRKI